MLVKAFKGAPLCARECALTVGSEQVPVCGSDKRTYLSQCHLEVAACLDAQRNAPALKKVHNGNVWNV